MNQNNNIYSTIQKNTTLGKKMLSVLIDPDKQDKTELLATIKICNNSPVDYFFVGGSIITKGNLDETTQLIKENTNKPVILFPGNAKQISNYADAILFLSLISGRNPEFLIDNQIAAVQQLQKTNLEIIPTGYLLVDCGTTTTAIEVSNTAPISHKNSNKAAITALAGEYMGMKLIYIDGGSGAQQCISSDMIAQTKKSLSIPLIIGGGIKTTAAANKIYDAGADLIVIGNGAEQNRELITEIAHLKSQINSIVIK